MLRWSVFALSTCRTGIHAQSCTPIILIFFFADSSVWSMVNAQLIKTTAVQHRRWNWPLFVNREIEFRSVIVPVLCTRPLCCVLHADLIRKANLLRVWNKQLIHKLKKVQNSAARLICRAPKSDHISPVLHTLHWLPVEQRIEYKLLLLAFKSVNNDGPSYLSDLLKFYIPSRQLRSSSDTRLLRIPSFRLKSLGQRKFSYQASVLWNSLPISLRHSNSTLAFRYALKTHLFPSQ